MQKLVFATTRPVLIVGGAATAVAGLEAVLPKFALEHIQKIAFVPDYSIIAQHWGMMVCLIGVFMVVAAFQPTWRAPILLYALVEKAFMVGLYVSNRSATYASGFLLPAVMDGALVIWLALYFLVARTEQAAPTRMGASSP